MTDTMLVIDDDPAATRSLIPGDFVGTSAAARAVREMAARIGRERPEVVLLTGERGTGKAHAARILHQAAADPAAPFVTLHCARRPAAESVRMLSGDDVPSAVTGGLVEQARGGTLFLDRIGHLGADLQARALRAVFRPLPDPDRAGRARGAGVRLIASTLDRCTVLDSELVRRAAGWHLQLPPLRARREDLDALVPPLLEACAARAGVPTPAIPEAVWRELRAHDWPGNVDELRNALERALLRSAEGRLASPGLARALPGRTPAVAGERLFLPLNGGMSLNEMDRFIILTALERSGFNVTAAARALGTTRETLRYRIHKYGLRARGAASGHDRNPSADSGS